MIEGMRIYEPKKIIDERGYLVELIRSDWKNFLDDDTIAQLNLSCSYPGIIRAWHRHTRGQNDYIACLKGSVRVCVYDDREGSQTSHELNEIILNGDERLQVA